MAGLIWQVVVACLRAYFCVFLIWQVKHISLPIRLHIATMCLALLHDDIPALLEEQKRIGFRTLRMDPYVLEKHARIAWDSTDRRVTEGLNIQERDVRVWPAAPSTVQLRDLLATACLIRA